MGPALPHLVALVTLIGGPHPADTTTFADRATSDLVARAVLRHLAQDSTVHDYHAKLRYRLSFAFGKRKWEDAANVAVEEQDANISWQLPNDLRVDQLGRRSASRIDGLDMTSTFSRPWFVPRTLGDSIRLFGADGAPSRAAPHPFAAGADRFYRYAAGDSLIITTGGRRITIRSITVMPKLKDGAYVAGRIWVDVTTGDIARFTFRFVGTELWTDPHPRNPKDTAEARRAGQFVSRILQIDADLEYGLQENVHWMPYREVISGRVTMPFGVDFAVPFQAATTFDDYVINSGTPVVFDAPFPRDTTPRRTYNRPAVRAPANGRRGGPPPRFAFDSTRPRNRTGYLTGGGRYEMHRPPVDSLRKYTGWDDSLVFETNPADEHRIREATSDLAHLVEHLPGDMTGRPTAGVGLERIADFVRYNRVEGTTLSFGAHVPVPISFTELYATVRYGFADERIMARAAMIRDAPAGRLTFAVSRDLADVDPFARGLTFGNSLTSSLVGHDDGAYLLAQGGRLEYETSVRTGTELLLGLHVEDESSVVSDARATFPRIVGGSGYFPSNDSVREGFATGAVARIEHNGLRVRWTVDGAALAVDGDVAGRVAAELRLPHLAAGWLTARAKAGAAAGADSVPQLALRAGGVNTVRGYDFGVERGAGLWSLQLDLSRPRGEVRPVVFLDAGQAANFSAFGTTRVLSGGGVGVSILGGLIRADLSHPITNASGRGVRFDLIFWRSPMSRRRAALLVIILAIAAGAASSWWRLRNANTTTLAVEKGRLSLQWRGRRYLAVATLPAHISWCPVTRLAQLEAISGDTGLLVTVYERDSLTAGPHPIAAAEPVAGIPRPGATVGIRWAPTPDTLVGFRAQSGLVTVRLGHGTASGTISAELHSVIGADVITLTAAFDQLAVATTAAGCT